MVERIEIIEKMLFAHLNWETIQQVTGVNKQNFEDIKMPYIIDNQAMSKNTSQISAYSELR